MERKVFSKGDWNRIGCRFLRGTSVIILFPFVALIWVARWIDEYGSEFLYWIDDIVESSCWHYVRWRKSK